MLSDRNYRFLFFLLGIAYLPGLFVPLMDNDSAHHANIALHMHLTGDYVSLVDHTGPYLDKPHLLFWLCAVSYKIFGVTTFAYKFPSLLFTILGTYSTYRLGKKLYNQDTGKLAALILATSFAFMLANNDVRMDAILTASIAFATWQLVEFADTKKIIAAAGAALGLAMAFSTKGLIGIIVPMVGLFFYILYKKDWDLFISWKWIPVAFFTALLISPVLYCYYLQFNLHPEIAVRGRSNINAVKFILWDQSFERFDGKSFGEYGKRDNLFFFHTFLWAFFPWCIIAYLSLFTEFKKLVSRKKEWLTTAIFIFTMAGISFSGFKLPHYLNIMFPTASILTASFLLNKGREKAWVRNIYIIQLCTTGIVLLFTLVLNTWVFPVKGTWHIYIILCFFLLLGFFTTSGFSTMQRAVLFPAAAMILTFFTMNSNFYVQLLRYQGGNELAFYLRDKLNTSNVYQWHGVGAPSWNFYTATNLTLFDDSLYVPGKETWLLLDEKSVEGVKAKGYELEEKYSTPDYGITKLNFSFINPATRKEACTNLILAKVTGRKAPSTEWYATSKSD